MITEQDWFAYVFTYQGNNKSLTGFFNAIELVMETGFAVTAFLALLLNLILPEELDDEATAITADVVDERADAQEWEQIRRPSHKEIVPTGSAGADLADVEKTVLVKDA